MKRLLKSYLAFTTGLYAALFLLIAPLLIILVGTLFGGILVGATLFLFAEIGGDFWLFGGVCSRHSGKLAYVMSSARGTEVIRNALTVSMIRTFLYLSAGLSGIGILASRIFGEGRLWPMFLPDVAGTGVDAFVFFAAFLFEGYALCIIGMMASRFFDSIRSMLYVCYTAFALLIWGYVLIWHNRYLALGLYAGLAVLSSILSLWLFERRMKRDYGDV